MVLRWTRSGEREQKVQFSEKVSGKIVELDWFSEGTVLASLATFESEDESVHK